MKTAMGANKGESNVIVGVCPALIEALTMRGWVQPVDGAGSCFVPTPAGRAGMMALIGGEDGGCEQEDRGEESVQ